ncbi:hypothetical protein SIN07_05705 [Pediococcus inopinatus]|uniref:hypothetical protein n=1 Tax=Pediococcus inopinatus TaxID=114090 RepID=UPI002A6AB340|nr:hypothetical protein [Pediococcus inopinatus]WPP08540.1 hypothetical protein SIN07_05705 [Pediococcus inopinatus]
MIQQPIDHADYKPLKASLDHDKINYRIIGSGSSGNCVIINDLMFDIGLSFKKIHKYLYGVKYVLISHVHGDHLDIGTYHQIRKKFPNIILIGDLEVHEKARMDIVAHPNEPIKLKTCTLTPFLAPHDVEVMGWTWQIDHKDLLYVTDTYSLENVPHHKYDYFFLEANHDQHKVDAIMNEDVKKYGYSAVDGSLRHMSTQDSKKFFYLNRKNKDSLWIRLHKSARFY